MSYLSVDELVRAKTAWKSIEAEMRARKIGEMDRLREFSELMRRYGSSGASGSSSSDAGEYFRAF